MTGTTYTFCVKGRKPKKKNEKTNQKKKKHVVPPPRGMWQAVQNELEIEKQCQQD